MINHIVHHQYAGAKRIRLCGYLFSFFKKGSLLFTMNTLYICGHTNMKQGALSSFGEDRRPSVVFRSPSRSSATPCASSVNKSYCFHS